MNEIHPLNADAWDEWVEYRTREKKIKIGPVAERKQQKMLRGYPPPIQQTIIDQSIMNSYQGLFPPKNLRPSPVDIEQHNRDVIQSYLSTPANPFGLEYAK